MKNIIFLVAFLLASMKTTGLIAQEYTMFYMDSAEWIMERVTPVIGAGDGHSFWKVYTLNDTIVGNETYRTIATKNLCSFWPDHNGNYIPQQNLFTEDVVLGGIRENDRRIYFKKFQNNSNGILLESIVNLFDPNDEYLLYDYNINIGDTIHYNDLLSYTVLNGDTSFFTHTYSTIVDDLVSGSSSTHRKYLVRNSSSPWYPYETSYLIEGIGSTYGLFGSYSSGVVSLKRLSVNNETIYGHEEYNPCDDFVTSIEPNNKNKLLIYPNPANKDIFIKSEEDIAGVRVINSLGTVLLSKENIGKSIRIDISEYGTNILFVYVNYKSGKEIIRKIVTY